MNCGYGEKLILYFYGETAGELKAGVEAHLRTCAGCRAELSALETAGGWLNAADSEPSARVLAAIMAEARRAAAPAGFGLRGWREALLGAALASFMAAGFSLSSAPSAQDLAWNSGLDSGLDSVEYSLYRAQSDLQQPAVDLDYSFAEAEGSGAV